jgi:5-methylcytosine-specific restriction enzyme subunit McrC
MTGRFNNLPINKVFEYGESVKVPRRELESYLCSLWNEYKDIWPPQEEKNASELDQNNPKYQPFLSFDGEFARTRNYIGFIHLEDLRIEIYPKIFKNIQGISNELMHSHLFYWFSYCKRVKFPFNQAFLDRFEIEELPELIIYLFAKQIHEVVSTQSYSSYEQVQETLLTPRGKINFDRYVNQMSYCNYHLIDCDYEPFVFDNSLNRIIKYCTRLLLSRARNIETQRILNEILFVLDEVDDLVCSVQQLSTLRISLMYNDYEEVIHICQMILENQVYSHEDYEMRNWSLLFPMELIFEEFIAGYIQEHFSDTFKVEVQKSDLYLHTSPNAFNIQHDILLTNRNTGEKMVVDTKYKPRWDLEKNDPKKGISQADMYQMISYAYRRGTDKVLLIYPNTSEELADDFVFFIDKGTKDETIKIKVADVPFWSKDGYPYVEKKLKTKLGETFGSKF